jgi:hypothetical protein
MEDRYSKYFQLTFNLFFTFLGFIVGLLLLMLGLRLAFGLLDYIPWFVYVYMLFIIMVPATLFISVFIIYFKRTPQHPSAVIRGISYSIFVIALIVWGMAFILDIISFFKSASREIGNYYSYNIILLAASVSAIFLVGVMQALSTEKEKDWMEKRKALENQ